MDPIFKVPRPVSRLVENSQCAVRRPTASSATSSLSQADSRKNDMFSFDSSSSKRATTSDATNPHLQIISKTNSFSSGCSAIERASSSNFTYSQLQLDRRNSAMFNSGLLFSKNTDPVPRQNIDDNQSLDGSTMSMRSNFSVVAVSAQLTNIFEALESTLIKKQNSLNSENVKVVCRKAKELALNTLENEHSLALSYKDGDGASIFSESAKSLCSTFSKTSAQIPLITSTKSHTEVLAELKLNKQPAGAGHSSQVQFFTSLETPKRNVELVDDSGDDDDDEEEVVPVIVLKNWFPVAVGNDLALSGTTEENNCIETKVIKKRINNRKVELVDGNMCEIIGSPADSVVSAFPKDLYNKLKNGLHAHWKKFQKDLANCQKNFIKKRAKETGRKERKLEYDKENQVKRLKIRKLSIEKKSNKKSPEISDSSVNISSQKKKRTPDSRNLPNCKLKDSRFTLEKLQSKDTHCKGSNLRTKSGRTVKPLSDFWRDYI